MLTRSSGAGSFDEKLGFACSLEGLEPQPVASAIAITATVIRNAHSTLRHLVIRGWAGTPSVTGVSPRRNVRAMKCEHCGDPLPALSRRNRRFCDARCRRRAFEERHAPAAPELAPVVPITDDRQAEELLQRVLDERRLVALVATGAKTNWRAAAFLLERRYPERWAPIRRPQADEAAPAVVGDDPFAEVDMLAARRRARRDDE